MNYAEFAPSPALAGVVKCIWTLEGDTSELEDGAQPVLPDGQPELVVHLGDPFDRVHRNGLVQRQPSILFAGQLTSQLVLRPTGRIAVAGVRFHADTAVALVDAPPSDFLDLTVGVDDLSGALARSIGEVRDASATLPGLAAALQQWLVAHLDASRIDARVRHAVDLIRRSHGRLRIDDVARRAELTRRHLERRFNARVGLTPKQLARIARFQRALQLLERLEGPARGTHTALACGYADQAHFVREFRELAGCPPGAHLLRRAELAGFFSRG